MATHVYKFTDSDSAATFANFAGLGSADGAQLYRTLESEAVPFRSGPIIFGKGGGGGTSPTLTQELAFINGIDPTTGKIDNTSYWGDQNKTAFKWGSSTLGTAGGTINYEFDPKSNFTATEKATFVKAMTLWASVADVHFKEVTNSPNLLLHRGNDGGEYTITPTTNGSGSTLGQVKGMAEISVDTSVAGFDLSGSFSKYGGYGLSSIIHEFGHLLGFGHGGNYNGNVNSSTQQFSAYDDRMYTTMSYIEPTDTNAKYYSQNPIMGTDWGNVQAPHTMMGLDIIDIQELYGASKSSPFTGGQTYGFHSNISGVLHDFYDFTVNTTPVETLYNQGTGNTLDLSGYTMEQDVTLAPGGFSNVGGLINNVFIDFSTQINHLITGNAGDLLIANDFGDKLESGGGNDLLATGAGSDTMSGGAGNDSFYFYRDSASTSGGKDDITDFKSGQDKIQIVIDGVTKFSNLTIKSDGHGGSLVTWAGETLDVEGDKKMKSSDFVFGQSNIPASFQLLLGGSHGIVATHEDLASLHYTPAFDHLLATHLAIA